MNGFELSYFDVLAPELPVVFCGINPSGHAAATGQNFGSPTNRFWRVLYLAGFTSVPLSGAADRQLLEFGCGITAVVGRATNSAGDLHIEEYAEARKGFHAKMQHFRPGTIAFLGKAAYEALEKRKVGWGPQQLPFSGAKVWVLPNPSGRNLSFSLEDLVAAYAELRISLEEQLEDWARINGVSSRLIAADKRVAGED